MALARVQEPLLDLLVVEIAAILHDVFDKKYTTATNTAEALEPFFHSAKERSGIDLVADGRADLICRVVENVSWTTESKLRTEGKIEEWHRRCVELHCVQDADRLDAIGAIGLLNPPFYLFIKRHTETTSGVMRCSAFSAVKNM